MVERWVLITGPRGFIGGHVARKFKDMGYMVVGLLRDGAKQVVIEGDSICDAWVELSLVSEFLTEKNLVATVHGLDGSLLNVFESNVRMPLRLLDICASFGCSLFLSTDTFFSKAEYDYPHMVPYIYSKRNFASWAKIYCAHNSKMRIINLRLEHVYGPGDKLQKFIPSLIDQLKKNKSFIELTKGEQMRDFIYVDDVAELFTSIIAKSEIISPGFTEHWVGTGEPESIKNLVLMLHKITKSKSEINFGALPYRNGEIMESKGRPIEMLIYGWRPLVSLSEGLISTVGKSD